MRVIYWKSNETTMRENKGDIFKKARLNACNLDSAQYLARGLEARVKRSKRLAGIRGK